MAPNYSIYGIPVFWILSLYPHAHGVGVIRRANNNKWNNVNLHGSSTAERYQKAVPAATYALFERAEAAHKNSMENAPFFIGAVIAGNLAGVEAAKMNAITGTILALRLAYSVSYIKITTQKYSYVRSLIWLLGVVATMALYVMAGNKWAYKA